MNKEEKNRQGGAKRGNPKPPPKVFG